MFDTKTIVIVCAAIFAAFMTVWGIVKLFKKGSVEGFIGGNGVTIDPVSGAYKGNAIYTNETSSLPIDELTKRIKDGTFISDEQISPGVSIGKGFDDLHGNYIAINQAIGNKNNEMQTAEDIDILSKNINSSANNAQNNLYSRAGAKPTKLYIEAPGVARSVIESKYMPERKRTNTITRVDTVIPVQGYDFNQDRIGEELDAVHFSTISRNKKNTRKVTAAGAAGFDVTRTGMVNVEGGITNDSPNGQAITDSIQVSGGNLVLNGALGNKKSYSTPMAEQKQENYTSVKHYYV